MVLVLFILLLIDPVSIRLNKNFYVAGMGSPAKVEAIIIIEPDPGNRQYEIIWADESGEISRSGKSMNGADEDKYYHQTMKLGPGNYVIIAAIKRLDGKVYSTRKDFTVQGGGS